MLRITAHARPDEHLLKLEGCLVGAWVAELDACWRQIAAAADHRRVRLDLTDVCYVDDAGRELMASMYHAGVRFEASGFLIPELVREIAEAAESREASESDEAVESHEAVESQRS